MAGMGSGVPQDKSFPSSAVLVLPGMMQQKKLAWCEGSAECHKLSGMCETTGESEICESGKQMRPVQT